MAIVEASGAGEPGATCADRDWRQIARAVANPLQLAPLLVVPLYVLGRRYGWLADLPLWVQIGSIALAQIASSVAYPLWPAGCSYRRMVARVGVMIVTVGAAIYVTGWGPVFAFAFVFAAAENIRVDGSRVAPAAVEWTLATVAAGQIAIWRGWVPTMIPEPQVHGVAVLAVAGAVILVYLLGWSASAREEVERSLRAGEEWFRALVQHASDAIVVVDAHGQVSYVSPSMQRVLGYEPGSLTSFGPDAVHPDDHDRVVRFTRQIAATPGAVGTIELRAWHTDGDWRWVELGVSNRLDDPSVGGLVCNLRDVTERRLFQDELTYQAYHDSLTRLPNRVHFLERIEDALDAERASAAGVAVLFLDLDGFKLVNDSLGHEVGDRLLVAVAERLRACVRPGDLVSRFGGDEFTVLLVDVDSIDDAVAVAERITESLRAPVSVGGRELFVSASIGIALGDGVDDLAGDLLRRADVAMYVAKEKGRSRWELFDDESALSAVDRLEVDGELRRALSRGELLVHFQPEVSLQTGAITGCEALVRWQHPERGLLAPELFVPMAEETSLILAVDGYVLRTACEWARRWSDDPRRERLVVSVNVSPRYLHQPDAVEAIQAVIERTGVDPRLLRIEITERTAMDDLDETDHVLHRLRRLGVEVAIDDFGTGYSSLGYLKRLPVDVVKLDRTFVESMHTEASDIAIVQAVITMAHALGMQVTAEGVERADQARLLRALGCDAAMGWYWAAATAPEDLPTAVEETGDAEVVSLHGRRGIGA